MLELKILFWAAVALILYTYAGYPAVLALLTRGKSRQFESESDDGMSHDLPSVTLIVPACNEERWIARKIENSLALDYPPATHWKLSSPRTAPTIAQSKSRKATKQADSRSPLSRRMSANRKC